MPFLLALHDSDGDENDLPPVLRMIAPGWHVLSPKLTGDTSELARWIGENAASAPYVFAYGTGADEAVKLLCEHTGVVAGGILLRPAGAPFDTQGIQLNGAPVLIVSGGEGQCDGVARSLTEAGAQVDLAQNTEHALTPQDFTIAKQWLENQL